MIPLLFAAALAAAPSPILKDLPTAPVQHPLDVPAARSWILKELPAAPVHKPLDAPALSGVLKIAPPVIVSVVKNPLAVQCSKPATKTAGPAGAPLKKLGDLPPGLEEHAVNRIVNGCPVREIVSGGRTYYLDMPVASLDRIDPAKVVIKER